MIRRVIISYALVYLNNEPLLAVIIHLLISTLYVIYLIKSRPFTEEHSTRFEIIVEIFVSIGAIYFMVFCNDDYESNSKTNIGWFYLAFNSVSLIYIARILIKDFIFNEIPEYVSTYKSLK